MFTFKDFQNLFSYDPFNDQITKILSRECKIRYDKKDKKTRKDFKDLENIGLVLKDKRLTIEDKVKHLQKI